MRKTAHFQTTTNVSFIAMILTISTIAISFQMKRHSKLRMMKKSNIKTFICSVVAILCELGEFGEFCNGGVLRSNLISS
jgi:hypothetical protein